MKHFLKCWPEYFQEVKAGRKLFEIRKWDRPYKVGDTLLLREFDRIKQEETGDEIEVEVVYLLDMTYLPGDNVPHFANYCCMSLRQMRTEPCEICASFKRIECKADNLEFIAVRCPNCGRLVG